MIHARLGNGSGDGLLMDLQLDGRTALITGSSKGIGEAIAKGLARERAIVVIHGRDQIQTEKVAHAITVQGGRAYSVIGDLTCDADVERLVEAAESLAGSIDILVNNAGGSGGSRESWIDVQPDAWTAAYDRNVLAALRITKRLLPKMQQAKWGRVINISSLAAMMPPPSSPDYSACKAAMNAMTVSMAKAVASSGVTVNAVSPGTIHSSTLDDRFPGGCRRARRSQSGRTMGRDRTCRLAIVRSGSCRSRRSVKRDR
jgi:NAD(P)-dependent dehydrogenase (short-subunit alcohol dehydrogenase family)